MPARASAPVAGSGTDICAHVALAAGVLRRKLDPILFTFPVALPVTRKFFAVPVALESRTTANPVNDSPALNEPSPDLLAVPPVVSVDANADPRIVKSPLASAVLTAEDVVSSVLNKYASHPADPASLEVGWVIPEMAHVMVAA